ncbi:MAG: hypothetical protein P0Y55_11600 [Candidatus Cohnella colombiensis]|uniref:DUF2269 family protein n=1 Tax=Candidatus Cohnella colombiensis TaxID=3121368 RepID=A0AA95ETM8_9BACL|nr:MAG: hypothetical protein P0Y55_11600 [Cohnella sp.]
MNTIMLFLHIIGAVGMGIYAILPFVIGKFNQVSGEAQGGLASGLVAAGKIGQYSLGIQFITGGYLLTAGGKLGYTVPWIIIVIVIFLAMGALSGIIQGPLKKITVEAASGQNVSAHISKVRTLSTILFVLFIVIIWFMQDPWYA